MLDPRVSVTLYPDLWMVYIERMCRTGNYQKVLSMIDELKTKCITDIFEKLYNSVMEKFILLKHRSQISTFLEIADHLFAR